VETLSKQDGIALAAAGVRMKKLLLLVLLLFLCSARPLICWKIDRNTLEWKRAYCYSTEFNALAPNEQPAPVEPTATPEPYTPEPTDVPTATPTATPTETWEWKPTATWHSPYPLPTMPTPEPYPFQWQVEP
jgi:hypothetical protein